MLKRIYLKTLSLLILLSLSSTVPAFAGDPIRLDVGLFSKGEITNWQTKKFENETAYSLVYQEGKQVLRAVSQQAASAFYREMKVDLTKTPYLNWSWRVDNIFPGINEQTKAGDDFPARIYLVVKTGFFAWQVKSINYVWSSTSSLGQNWPNPFTDRVVMIPLHSGNEQIQTWIHEKRNIREDLRDTFGKDYESIDGIAIMTDTDNAKGKATAYYGDIYFTSE